jgi:hypothetical protein
MLSKCCEGCSHLIRDICEKKYSDCKDVTNFIYCDTQNIRLLIEVAT